ncbi:hypothetical protein ABMA27_005746 [Loxostege sticticalis]|uniref:Peptidase aspartic putative domain-containing protein n=1 Tax=Loxostege sticticalis TaxID=481309 RepID=A0ABR3HKK1_LOXSC
MEALLDFQMELYERIIKAQTNFKKSPKERITKQHLEGRLELIEQMWFEFLSGHKELKRGSDKKILLETDYVKEDIYDKAEECYLNYKCDLKTSLDKFNIVTAPCTSDSNAQSNVKSSSHIKLPKINIPNFSGKYHEWTAFRDLYTALVHSNQDLSKVQKLHYLKSYLTGEAEQYLRHIPIANENYDRCWKLLEDRYNNKKYICHLTLKRLLSQRNIINESASSLKDLIDTTNDCLASLTNIGVDVGSWDVMIIHILTLKLDPETKRQWEFHVSNNSSADELPTYANFKEFLTNRYRALEFLDSGSNSVKKSQTQSNPPVNKMNALHVTHVKCLYCSEAHTLAFCKQFAKETVDARRDFVKNNNACFNCLGSNHSAKFCRTNVRCRVCKRKHHSLLHPSGKAISEITEDREQDISEEAVASTSKQVVDSKVPESSVSCFSSGRVNNQALLATALVRVKSKTSNDTVRALLDQGSQCSFITECTVQRLGLRRTPILGQLSGLGEHESTSKAMVTMEIQSRVDSNFKIKVEAYVLKTITAPLPTYKIDPSRWIELEDLVLADPEYHTPSGIDVLLGVGIYNQILLEGLKRSPEGELLAQATSLGWILSGQIIMTEQPVHKINVLHCCSNGNNLLKGFWELETESEIKKEKKFTDEEKRCEEIFNETTARDDEGSFIY